QTLSGASGLRTVGDFRIVSTSTLGVGSTLTVDGPLTIRGTLRLDAGGVLAGAGTYTYDAGTGRLAFNQGASAYAVSGNAPWPSVNGPTQVWVQSAGGIVMQVARTVTSSLQLWGPVGNASQLTVLGNLELNNAGLLANSPV